MRMMFIPGCRCCGCTPCEAACDDTPAENFETVHVSVAGNENLSDGVLTASGDTNPVPTYPGGTTGPYQQTITGTLTIPGTRFPCYARAQFWRNEADQEPGGSPTMDLDYQYVLIKCESGKVRIGPLELSAGESAWYTTDTTLTLSPAPTYVFESDAPIPLVGGDGDQSGSPPAFLGGTFGVEAVCLNAESGAASVTITATIAWSEEAAYHVLYGRMVECYDELPPVDPGDCLDCDGTPTPAPDTLYLTISNFDGGGAVDANGTTINYDGTYAFDLTPSVTECARYLGDLAIFPINQPNLGGSLGPAAGFQVIAPSGASFAVQANKTAGDGGGYMYFAVFHQFAAGTFNEMACGGDPVTGSVSGEWKTIGQGASGYDISFDWEISS